MYILSETVATAEKHFVILFRDYTGTFYTLLQVLRGCEVIYVPVVIAQPNRDLK
jgi:hypothetical protein